MKGHILPMRVKFLCEKIGNVAKNIFYRIKRDFEHAKSIEHEITTRKREQILKLARHGIDVSRFY